MGPAINLPRLVFGSGALAMLPAELGMLGVARPLLISDRGLDSAGIVARVQDAAAIDATFTGVPENPTADGADAALAAYRQARCDGIVALGGGSVLDTAKLVSALAGHDALAARKMIGSSDMVTAVVPLVAIPTTVGTGSESSPVAALHREPGGPAIGTRHRLLVPPVALCDPDLVRTLPRHLIAATAIDALSHCVEGFFADPANPVIDALALDGVGRVFRDVHAALMPEGDDARGSLMAAAFSGGAAIHKGLGPAHAVALACGDQHAHHGTLIGVALAATTRLLAVHLPEKAAQLAVAMGLTPDADISDQIAELVASLDLPTRLAQTGYAVTDEAALVDAMKQSPFNRTSPYVPTHEEYGALLTAMR